jgi:hypothetical protein
VTYLIVVLVVGAWLVYRDIEKRREAHRHDQYNLRFPELRRYDGDFCGGYAQVNFDEMKYVDTWSTAGKPDRVEIFHIRRTPTGQWQELMEDETYKSKRARLTAPGYEAASGIGLEADREFLSMPNEWKDISGDRLEPLYQLYVHHKDSTVLFPNAYKMFK